MKPDLAEPHCNLAIATGEEKLLQKCFHLNRFLQQEYGAPDFSRHLERRL
jgi:hypothetical protein